MSISIGIVGLPNSGKSTLFNVLIQEKKALTAVTPFTTIAHNEGVVEDVKFIDIAGLVRGSSMGQGFGNTFLEKIRGVDVILHVVRAFYSPIIGHPHKLHEPGSLEQVIEDIEVVNKELRIAGVVKPVIYILNFDENKFLTGVINEYLARVEHKYNKPVIGLSAKLEEEIIDLTGEERTKKLIEIKIDKTALERVMEKTSLLLSKNSLN